MMKWNKEIISEEYPIYDANKAKELFKNGKYDFRELSLMKQENIRMAIKEGYNLVKIDNVKRKDCGYCFKYQYLECKSCPLYKKVGMKCYELPFYNKRYKTFKGFAEGHEAWCKKLGIWLKRFE